jgi:hypothetical protein
VGADVAAELLELELLELELPSSPARDEDPEALAGEDARVPEAVAEWAEPGRMKATTPAVASPVRPTAAVVVRTRARPRRRAAAAVGRSRLR